MRPRHLALPARRGGKCFGSARRLRIAFRSTAFSPKSDARTPAHRRAGSAHSKSPATAGRNTTGENLLKLATASSSYGELRKLPSIAVRISRIARLSFRAKSRNLSILFPILPLGHSRTITAAWRGLFAALDLEHHALKRVLKNRWHLVWSSAFRRFLPRRRVNAELQTLRKVRCDTR